MILPTKAKLEQEVATMTEKTELTVCVDEMQAEIAGDILNALGISISEAISMFLAQIVLRRGMPFPVALSSVEDDMAVRHIIDFFDDVDDGPDEGQLSIGDDVTIEL